MHQKVKQYIEKWKNQGYEDDIPDEVPNILMKYRLAPSYKAIAIAILKNDHNMVSLGFAAPKSPWYSAIKRNEIAQRNKKPTRIYNFFKSTPKVLGKLFIIQ